MEVPKSTEANVNSSEKSHIRCPKCDTKMFQAVAVVDMIYKCKQCYRRYLINVQDGSVSIKLLNKPKGDD